jgi:ATP-dependent exoDNAse (exonuclease V) beta subunit
VSPATTGAPFFLIIFPSEGGRYEVKHLSEEKLVEILSNPVSACLQGKRLYKEQKFLVALPACETFGQKPNADSSWKNARGEEVIFQGAIDLLAIGEDGDAQIIDYKFSFFFYKLFK